MKKTTIISTLAMVIIVALALTTATFAWYSANSQVTATATATAATSGTANLAIAASGSNSTAITLPMAASPAGGMTPAALQIDTKPAVGTTTQAAFTSALKTASIGPGGVLGAPNGAAYISGSLSVINNSPDKAAGAVTVTLGVINVTKTAANAVRVAIFKMPTESAEFNAATATYVGTLATTGAKVAWGTTAAFVKDAINTTVFADETYAATAGATGFEVATSISANKNYQAIGYVIWYDGEVLDDTLSGAECDITLSFNAD